MGNHRCSLCSKIIVTLDGAFIPKGVILICHEHKQPEDQPADKQTVSEAIIQRLEQRFRQAGYDDIP